MNALSELIIKIHLTAKMLPDTLTSRLHDEELGATQTVEVIALAAVIIAVLIAVAAQAPTIAGFVESAIDTLIENATRIRGGTG